MATKWKNNNNNNNNRRTTGERGCVELSRRGIELSLNIDRKNTKNALLSVK